MMFISNKVILSICILLLIACKDISTKQNDEDFIFPHLIQTSKNDNLSKINFIEHGNHFPLYIGKTKDTIVLSDMFLNQPPAPPFLSEIEYEKWYNEIKEDKHYQLYFNFFKESNNYKSVDSLNLKIWVDTSQTIENKGGISYPVLIYNQNKDTCKVGFGKYIYAILQAKNKNGVWIDIEKRYRYSCAVGEKNIILPPNHILITPVYDYDGDFKTTLRIKLGNNYSNEYNGNIDKSLLKLE